MHFYFDESGDFSPATQPGEHLAGVVMGVAVSNAVRRELENDFAAFEASLNPSERESGEAKGRLLSQESRQRFCDLLARYDGISLTPVTLDLSELSSTYRDHLSQEMHDVIVAHSEKMIHESARQELLLLARQVSNLSTSQLLRIYAWCYCIGEAIQHAVLFLSTGPHAESWRQVRFEIDRVQLHSGSREERVVAIMIYSWLVAWSVRKPLVTIREIHTPDHPFVEEYQTERGTNLNKLLQQNFNWVSSSESWGIRIADIGANIVYRAVQDLDDRNGNVSIFASLMRKSRYGYARGPGLFSPTEVPDHIEAKYMVLSEVMRRNQ